MNYDFFYSASCASIFSTDNSLRALIHDYNQSLYVEFCNCCNYPNLLTERLVEARVWTAINSRINLRVPLILDTFIREEL